MQNAFTICHLQKSVIVHGANNIQTFRAKYVDQQDDPQWKESFSKHLWFAFVVVFWLKWAGYLAVAGLNLLAQISDRISPSGV